VLGPGGIGRRGRPSVGRGRVGLGHRQGVPVPIPPQATVWGLIGPALFRCSLEDCSTGHLLGPEPVKLVEMSWKCMY